MTTVFPKVHFVASNEVGGRPCIVADGGKRPEALITLSHWPGSGTPEALLDDLSTQITFHYLDRPEFHVDADIVTNDHFDEDGLASIFALTEPQEALARRERICDFAEAGDFGTFRNRDSALAAFTVSAFADPERSPLGAGFFRMSPEQQVSGLFSELLGRLTEILDYPGRYRDLWREEVAMLEATERAISHGEIRIDEMPELDLAVVHLPENYRPSRVHRFAQARDLEYHPMAIYNATQCLRVLYVQGQKYEFEYRYESWVRYISRKPLPRVDLTKLADDLTLEEESLSGIGSPGIWSFDGVSDLTPRLFLKHADCSRIKPSEFCQKLADYLIAKPAAWDPYI